MANISKAPIQPHTHLITRGRFVVLLLGLFVLTANSMADVVFSDNTFTGDGTYSAAVQSDEALTATPDTGKTITLSGVISGACSITQNGAGTLVISGANTYTGETKVLNGTLNLTQTGSGNGKASLNIGNTITVEGGSSVLKGHGTIFGYGAGSIGRLNLNNGGTLENDLSTAHVTISAPVYMNNGVITSTGNGDGYGNFIIDCGIHVTGGTDNELNAVKFQIRNDQGSGNPNKEQGGTFDIASGAKLSVNSNISNYNSESMTPPVIKKGAGELVLSGASTYTKGTQIEAGTLTVSNNAALGNNTGTVTFTGNSTLKAGADNLTLANPITINSGKTGTVDTNGKTMSLGGVISGAGALTKTGTGALTLSGANTYTGITTVSGGTLNITGSAFASRLVITGGASATIDAGETGVVNMNADGYNTSLMIGNGSTGSLTLNSGNVTVHNSGSGSNGSIQLGTNSGGKGDLTINGGTMQVDGRILMGANGGGIEGTLNMNGGTLTLGVPGSYTTATDPSCGVLWFGANKSTVNLNGGTLAMFGMKHNNPNASSSFNFNGGTLKAVADNNTDFLTAASGMKFYIKQGGAIFDTNGYNVKVSAKLEQGTDAGDAAGKLIKNGAGTLTLSGASTFTGDMDINAGTVVIAYNAKGGGTTDTATALGNPSVVGRKITVHSGAELVTSNGGAGTDVFGGAEAHPKFTLVADGGTIATATDQLTSYGDIELKNGGVFEDRGGHSTWYTIFNGDVSVTSGNATIQSTSAGRGISLRGYRDGVNAGVTFDVAKNSTLTVSALLKDSPNSKTVGSFTKSGEGTMILSNRNNTYTGNIVVDGGILKASGGWNGVNKPTVLGQYGSKTVTVNSGAEFIFAAQDVVSNASTSSPVQFIINGGKISNEGAVYNNLNNTVFKNGGELYASNGHGSWKAYKLSTKVSVLRDAPSAQPAKITASTNGNATISFGHTTSLYVEDVTSASATELDTKSDLIISAKVTNPNTESNKTFYKDGVGTLEFTAANTFNGTVGIREGVLRLSGAGTLGTSAVTLTTDGTKHGTLEFMDSTASIPNAISGAGDILVSSGTANITGAVTQTSGKTTLANGTTLNISNNATLNNLAVVDANSLAMVNVTGNLTLNNDKQTKFIGPISAGTIEKTGDGTLQLYAAADGEGIHAERFIVSSGRLDMKDYFVGKLEVNEGATLSPGNSVGTLTVDGEGAVVINNGAILLIEQDKTGIDQIIAKSFEIADDAVLQLAFTSVQPGQTYEIFIQKDEDGNVKDFEGKYADEGFWTSLLSPESAYYWNLTLDGNVVMATMDANAVPEPSTWALLALGVVVLFLRKRVRN